MNINQWDKNVSLAVFLLVLSHDSHSSQQIYVSLPLRRMHMMWYAAWLKQNTDKLSRNLFLVLCVSIKTSLHEGVKSNPKKEKKPSSSSLQKEVSGSSISLGPATVQLTLLLFFWQELVTCLYLNTSTGNCILWITGCAWGKTTILISKSKASKT